MTRGEVSPFVQARADTDHYKLGLAIARNWLVMRYGGLTRKPGSFFDNSTKTPAKKSEFRWFNFSQTQNYALEFGDLYVRFHTTNGRVETSPGVAYEVITPWLEADLPNIITQQAGDIVYVACYGYELRELKRISETNWTISIHQGKFGPYLAEAAVSSTILTPSGRGSAVPVMTSNTAPSGTVGTSGMSLQYGAFDGNLSGDTANTSSNIDFISYTFGGGITKVVDAYWIKASSGSNPSGAPSVWEFQGFDGTNWVTLDSRSGQTGWYVGETRFFEFANTVAYTAYRLYWYGTGFIGTSESRIAEMGWHESGDTQTPFTLTASNTTNINNGAGFLASDVGRYIRLLGNDSKWRDALIVTRSSTTVVTVRLYGHALPPAGTGLTPLQPISRFQLGAFSAVAANSPRAVSMYENRLAIAGTQANPLDLWFSKSAEFNNMGISTPLVANDAVNVRMSNGQLNEVLWAVEAGDFLVGTAGGLRVIGRNDPGKPFGPDNVRQKGQTAVRASPLQPLVIERTVIFPELHGKALYESAFSFEDDGYVALELTMLAEHIFAGGVKQMAYQDAPSKVLWVVLKNGQLAACTYDRGQKVFGVCPCDSDGGLYESVVVLPGTTYDVPMFIVKRGARRDIERMADPYRVANSTYPVPIYFDGCSYYNGAPTASLSNLTQLANLTVGYWADGADRGNVTVSAGGVATFPASFSQIVIGHRYKSKGQTLRLAAAANQDGGIMGRRVRVLEGWLDVLETYGLYAGSKSADDRDELEKMTSTTDAETRPVVPDLYTGFVKMHTDDNWEGNGVYVFETDSGYPATIRAIMTSVETEP